MSLKKYLAGRLPADQPVGATLRRAKASVAVAPYRMASRLIPDSKAKYYCPCCETKLLAWQTARFTERPERYDVRRYANTPQDVVCPVCGSIPRHRIIAWHLSQHPELVANREILHFAPEHCLTRWFQSAGIHVTTADLCHPADLQLDIQDTGLPDRSYDVVVCNHVLEHVRDYRLALRELHRILRDGGLLICSFPIDPRYETVYEDPRVTTEEERILHFGQSDHLRVFGTDSAQILEEAGFDVKTVDGADCPDTIRPVTGPADYDAPAIFFCAKR